MSANNSKIQSVIENTFVSAIERLKDESSSRLINDLYVQADRETGELQIYDEEENLIDKVVIFDWVNNKADECTFNKKVSAVVKAVLTILSSKDAFADSPFMRPLSISLTDDNFVVIDELLFLDDEMFRLDDPLLKDLDADLDRFLNQLLSDID